MSPTDPTPTLLVQRGTWLRRLALELLGDAHAAEDVAQDAAVLALEKGRGAEPGWLAGTVRRRAAHRRRSEGRRRWRERAAARQDRADASDELLSRHETRERVARAVTELEEPYRSLLLRRYYEGQTPREIARATGDNPSTVRGRLQGGLERLRARLRRDLGDERWGVALLPLAAPRTWTWIPVAGAAAAGAIVLALALGGEPAAPAPALQEAQEGRVSTRLTGRLVGDEGHPLPDVHLRVVEGAGLDAPSARGVRTDEHGRFALELTLDRDRRGHGEAYVTLRAGAAGHQASVRAYHFPPVERGTDDLGDWMLVAGGCLRGTLVDGLGNRLVGERVWLNYQDLNRGAHGDGRGLAQETATDGDGRFELPVPMDGLGFVRTTAGPKGRAWSGPFTLDADEDRELGRLVVQDLGVISGRLVDGAGRPVAGASASVRHVESIQRWTSAAGDRAAQLHSDSDGRFRLAGLEPGRYSLRAGNNLEVVETGAGPIEVAWGGPVPEKESPRRPRPVAPAFLRVAARTPSGAPLHRLRVEVERLDSGEMDTTRYSAYWTDAASGGLSGPLEPGRVRVSVSAADPRPIAELRALTAGEPVPTWLPPLPVDVELRVGEEHDLTFDLLPAGWVRLVTHRAAEEPPPSLLGVVVDGDRRSATTLLGGRYRYLAAVGDVALFGPLLPGEYGLDLRPAGFEPVTITARVEGGAVTTHEITFVPR